MTPAILPPFTCIMNFPLSSGLFPPAYKRRVISPVLNESVRVHTHTYVFSVNPLSFPANAHFLCFLYKKELSIIPCLWIYLIYPIRYIVGFPLKLLSAILLIPGVDSLLPSHPPAVFDTACLCTILQTLSSFSFWDTAESSFPTYCTGGSFLVSSAGSSLFL